MTSPPVPAPVQAATEVADTVLRPQAERVDVEGVDRGSLDAVARAGLLRVTVPVADGGTGEPAAVGRAVTEVLAGACGSTWFVTTQHALPLATVLATQNAGLRERRLPGLVSGRTLAGVAVAHLRRAGPPAVTATRDAGKWRFDGTVGWTTGWGLVDLLLLYGRTSDDVVVAALVPAAEAAGLSASSPLRLAAMQGTRTVRLQLTSFRVADDDVVLREPEPTWQEADALKTANVGPHTFGLQAEAVRRLVETGRAPELAERLAAEARSLRGTAYALIDEVPAHERLQERLDLRAAALELAVRSTTALVAATGGGGMSLDAAPQRLAREALFGVVQAQTAPVRAATLAVLGR